MSLGARGGPARSGLPFADRGRQCAPSPPPARAPPPNRWPTTGCSAASGGTSGGVAGGMAVKSRAAWTRPGSAWRSERGGCGRAGGRCRAPSRCRHPVSFGSPPAPAWPWSQGMSGTPSARTARRAHTGLIGHAGPTQRRVGRPRERQSEWLFGRLAPGSPPGRRGPRPRPPPVDRDADWPCWVAVALGAGRSVPHSPVREAR